MCVERRIGPGRLPHVLHRPRQPLVHVWRREVSRGGTQDESGDEVPVAAPHQLGDGSPHRVADEDRMPHPEHRKQRGYVVGAVLQAERISSLDAPAVAAVVQGNHAIALGERCDRGRPVQRPRRRPAVEQHHRRSRSRRMPTVVGEGRSTLRDIDQTPTGAGTVERSRRVERQEAHDVQVRRPAADIDRPSSRLHPPGRRHAPRVTASSRFRHHHSKEPRA
jgi:hypothetical protein